MNLLFPGRRVGVRLALAGLALLLSACAATAPPPVDSRAQALQSLGFEAVGDGWAFSLNGKLLFATDSDQLDAQSQSTAERLGRELAMLGVDLLRVEGHTDSMGGAVYNRALSMRRAQAVADAMASAGLRDAKIKVFGMGEAYPVSTNDTPESRLENRRVAVIVPAR